MEKRTTQRIAASLSSCAAFALTAHLAHGQVVPPPYSPYAGSNYPTKVLFGDTHLHTAVSMDAGMTGATLMAADAYRFSKGEEITSNTGKPIKLSRPVDGYENPHLSGG
jgi:hypothetical protein